MIRSHVDFLIDRCAEISSGEAPPGLLTPLAPLQNLAAFLLDALRGADKPYVSTHKSKAFAEGPLGTISNPLDLFALSDTDLSALKDEFANVLKYVREELAAPLIEAEGAPFPAFSYEALVKRADGLMRLLVTRGWHLSHLHAYFSQENSRLTLMSASDIREAINQILARFPDDLQHQFTVYTPSLVGRGGADWGFTSVGWDKLPDTVQEAFRQYVAGELRTNPDAPTEEQHDARSTDRYRTWQLEKESLTLSKYVRAVINDVCDPYSAAEVFREKYRRMKSVVYISRKRSSSGKGAHYGKRNYGGSPVQLRDVSVIVNDRSWEAQANSETVTTHLSGPSFPYQKLKNEFPRQRELLGLFFDKCEVFRQLTTSYANALEAFANRDIEDIVRNLVVATELIFKQDHFDNIGPRIRKKLLLNEGAMLLALDWLRDQFQSLALLTKKRSPGLSEDRKLFQIHLQIIDDELWSSYASKVSAPALLRWRRDELMATIRQPIPRLDVLRARFEAELTILWHARHQFAHRASVFREGYFVALLLNLFRIALDFRFSCYAIWLEWCASRIIEGGKDGPTWATYESAFNDGWKEEFALRVGRIAKDFEDIRTQGITSEMVKSLVLGAGYAGLGVHPRRTTPETPLSRRDTSAVVPRPTMT